MEVGAKLLAQSQLLWCAIKNHGDHDKYYHLQKQLHSKREESAWVVISVIVGKMIPLAPIPSNSPGTARAKLKMGYFLEQCIKMIPLSSDTFKQPFFRIPLHISLGTLSCTSLCCPRKHITLPQCILVPF